MVKISEADKNFARILLLAACVAVALSFGTVIEGPMEWSDWAAAWLGIGAISVGIRVCTEAGYIALAPRFDAVLSYIGSAVAGPFSLARSFWRMVR